MILELKEKYLREKMENFDFLNPTYDPIQLSKDLVETMNKYSGIGLSANQVGVNARAFSIRTNPYIVMFNPKIVDQSEETNLMEEGCLSFPNLIVKIKRPNRIRVRYTEPNGNTLTKQFEGLTARTILHELDHLDGIMFYDRANRYHREVAFRRMKNAT